jgi:hypothetical protein
MVEISHREKAWTANHQDKATIDYTHGFDLC